MMPDSARSTQQLAEFLAVFSSERTEASAALAAVERAAEALDAEVVAIVSGETVLASVGYPEGRAPGAELAAVTPGVSRLELAVPGVGRCPASAVSLAHPPGAKLVLARSRDDGLSPEEASLLRGMAQVTSMTLRTLSLLADERAARRESESQAAENARLLIALTVRQGLLERLASEHAALRQVATLVAGNPAPEEIFAAVAEAAAGLLGGRAGIVCRYDRDGAVTIVAGWGDTRRYLPVGTQLELEGECLAATVLHVAGPARLGYDQVSGPIAERMRAMSVRSSVGAPILVDGRVWGALMVTSDLSHAFQIDSEGRLAAFTGLVATAISNADSRAQLTASRARIVAASDATRRRIERDLHDGIQQRLVTLGLALEGLKDAARLERSPLLVPLSQLQAGLGNVLEEVREISRGVHPAILSEGGLRPALKSLARRSAVPVQLEVGPVKRLPLPLEAAVYYVASEALTNAAKHAHASVAAMALDWREGTVRLSIRDDGVGGADPAMGSGIIGMSDRIEALGGTLVLSSPPGAGTSMIVQLPTDPRQAPLQS
jgi:signal transduction histidine kinase